ncbi:phage late control D family protein [Microbulbifer taiwanensis]|uniref:Phage late control D family protein n=1 Tax=Microbulbifer taiwanensis TaxID=986746 RepID=A0ABW1YGD1_9GAMM|nr:phage late control D family protein [Microbulbifer taiwanensis]
MTLAASPLIADYQIKVNRVALDTELMLDVLEVAVLDDLAGPSMFSLRMATWRQATQSYTWVDSGLFAIGAEVEVSLGYVDRLESIIVGEITSLELSVDSGEAPELLVRGYDRRHRLLRGEQTRTFVNMSDSDIAAAIARDNNLTPDVVDSRVVHEHVWQHAQSDLGFLCARAAAIGYEVVVGDKTLYFRPHATASEPALVLATERDIKTFGLRMTAQGQVGTQRVSGWDVGGKQAIFGAASGAQVVAMGGTPGAEIADKAFGASDSLRTGQPIVAQDQADSASLGQLGTRALAFILGEGICPGSAQLRAGKLVSLSGLGDRFSGPYYIEQARHSCSAESGYQTAIKVRRNAT